MHHLRTVALAGVAILAVAGCGRKPSVKSSPAAAVSSDAQAGSQAAGTAAATPGSDCPPLPAKANIRHGIESALQQIYGADEGGQKIVVLRVAATDCQHATVTYRLSAPGSPPQTSPIGQTDDGHWVVTLYKKQYPL